MDASMYAAANVAPAGQQAGTLFDNIPAELKALAQWVGWKYEDHGKPKRDKVPYNPRTGQRAKSNDPSTWGTFAEAAAAFPRGGFDGLGFVFSEADPYTGIDLDSCRDPETGQLEPRAGDLVERLNSYTEASPSGTGVHIFVKAVLPAGGRKKDKVEMYSEGRFFTITGEHIGGTSSTIEERTAELAALHADVFGKRPEKSQEQAHTGNGSTNRHTNPLSDEALLLLAKRAKNGELFARLWSGDTSGYPSQSEADQALCNLLAFYCGCDPSRIDRLFRQSSLYREKWDKKHYANGQTYGQVTIEKALACTREFYHGAGNWREEYNQALTGKRIVILPDNDEPGEQHAQEVARSLLPVAAAVKILRPEDLRTEHRPQSDGLALTRLGDLLNEPEELVPWLVDKLLPAGGFSLLAAKPKAGKSTLARNLALAVAQGQDFFGKFTQQGPVIYLALEEKRSEVKKHFRDMGATGEEEIYIHAASAPVDALQQIRAVVEEKKPVLLIIDPLFKLTRVKDGNDYAQVIAALEPLLMLARETGAHVLAVHHAGKSDREGGDAILTACY